MGRGQHERLAPAAEPLMPGRHEIYLEYFSITGCTRVVAVDSVTGIEVTVFGPLDTAREDLERVAVRKLRRRIAAQSCSATVRERRGRLA